MSLPIIPLDYSHFDGGLVRMLDRFHAEGTLTGDLDADDYLRREPTAALLGLLYDQRVRAEYAFTGPHRLRDRLGHLDLKHIAAMDADALRALFAKKPAQVLVAPAITPAPMPSAMNSMQWVSK